MINLEEVKNALEGVAEQNAKEDLVPNYKAFISNLIHNLSKLQSKLGDQLTHEFTSFVNDLIPHLNLFLSSKQGQHTDSANKLLRYIAISCEDNFDIDIFDDEDDADLKSFNLDKNKQSVNLAGAPGELEDKSESFTVSQLLYLLKNNVVKTYLGSLKGPGFNAQTTVKYNPVYLFNFAFSKTVNTKVFREKGGSVEKQKEAISSINNQINKITESLSTMLNDLKRGNKDIYLGSAPQSNRLSGMLREVVLFDDKNINKFNEVLASLTSLVNHYDYIYRAWFMLHCYNKVYYQAVLMRQLILKDLSKGDGKPGSDFAYEIKTLNKNIDMFRERLLDVCGEMIDDHQTSYQYVRRLREINPKILKYPELHSTFRSLSYENIYDIGKSVLATFPNDGSFVNKSASGFKLVSLDTKNRSFAQESHNPEDTVFSQIRQDFLARMLIGIVSREGTRDEKGSYTDHKSEIIDAIFSNFTRSIVYSLVERKNSGEKSKEYLDGVLNKIKNTYKEAKITYDEFFQSLSFGEFSQLQEMPQDLEGGNTAEEIKQYEKIRRQVSQHNHDIISPVINRISMNFVVFANCIEIIANNVSPVFSGDFLKTTLTKKISAGNKDSYFDIDEFYRGVRGGFGRTGSDFVAVNKKLKDAIKAVDEFRSLAKDLHQQLYISKTQKKPAEFLIKKLEIFKAKFLDKENQLKIKTIKEVFISDEHRDSDLRIALNNLLSSVGESTEKNALEDKLWGPHFKFAFFALVENLQEELPKIFPENFGLVFMKNPDVIDVFENIQSTDDIKDQMLRLKFAAKSIIISQLIEKRAKIKIDPVEIWNRISGKREISFFSLVSEVCKTYNLDVESIFGATTLDKSSFLDSSGLKTMATSYFSAIGGDSGSSDDGEGESEDKSLKRGESIKSIEDKKEKWEEKIKSSIRFADGKIKTLSSLISLFKKFDDEDKLMAVLKAEKILSSEDEDNRLKSGTEEYDMAMAAKNVATNAHKTAIYESKNFASLRKSNLLRVKLKKTAEQIINCMPDILKTQNISLKNVKTYRNSLASKLEAGYETSEANEPKVKKPKKNGGEE